mmetsp:Transcript_87228/g.182556  ORF Transcript_87228/g.182556 Transcript_87228/m.182556 type:complete len:87 (-) Transcript_87228:117-377(-)
MLQSGATLSHQGSAGPEKKEKGASLTQMASSVVSFFAIFSGLPGSSHEARNRNVRGKALKVVSPYICSEKRGLAKQTQETKEGMDG